MIPVSSLDVINSTCEASVAYGVGPVDLVPSGIPQLDAAIGGIPRGRVIEIHGGEGSGKTALALHLVQQLGGPALYIDADHGLSPYILGDQELYLLDVPSLEDAKQCQQLKVRYTAMPELYIKAMELFRAGKLEEARQEQNDCCRVIYKMCSTHGNMYATIKEILRRNGGPDVGSVRAPLAPLTEGDGQIVDECAAMIRAAIAAHIG